MTVMRVQKKELQSSNFHALTLNFQSIPTSKCIAPLETIPIHRCDAKQTVRGADCSINEARVNQTEQVMMSARRCNAMMVAVLVSDRKHFDTNKNENFPVFSKQQS